MSNLEVNNFDKLVSAVTNNILEKANPTYLHKETNKACLVLIPNIVFDFPSFVSYIEKAYQNYNIIFASEKEVLDALHLNEDHTILLQENNPTFLKMADKYEQVVLVGPRVEKLKALTVLNDSCTINHIVIGRLMAGKNVSIVINANTAMTSHIVDLLGTLRSMGVDIINLQETNKGTIFESNFITEKDVLRFKNSNIDVIKLSKNQRISPLAKDKLREYKIMIEYSEEDES